MHTTTYNQFGKQTKIKGVSEGVVYACTLLFWSQELTEEGEGEEVSLDGRDREWREIGTEDELKEGNNQVYMAVLFLLCTHFVSSL